jgi:hypothetical protein
MKRLLLGITVATLAYSAWWFYAAQNLRSSAEDWFADQRAAGWEASFSDLTVRGFPNRTDLTISDPVLISPDGTVGWQSPFFQILGLSYKSGHVIVAWADSQTLTTPEGQIDITSDGLRASVVYQDDLILRSNLEAAVLNITAPEHAVAIAGITAALERIEPADADYRIALLIDGLALSNPKITGTLVPESLATLRADTSVGLANALTPQNITEPPALTKLTLRNTETRYGALVFKMTGDSTFDSQGLATGEVTLQADNWRESLNAAKANGDLPPSLSDGLIELLGVVASFSGSRDTLDVTLGLNRGVVLLGPLPIGRVPPLLWH